MLKKQASAVTEQSKSEVVEVKPEVPQEDKNRLKFLHNYIEYVESLYKQNRIIEQEYQEELKKISEQIDELEQKYLGEQNG